MLAMQKAAAVEPASPNLCEAQTERVRVIETHSLHELEFRKSPAEEWRRVVSSKERVDFPISTMDGAYVAYIGEMRIRDKLTPWLYLQRISTGWREAVIPLAELPKQICFDTSGVSLYIVEGSGERRTIDLSEQIKLLTKKS
jgi:hypothetical protein